MHLTEHGVAKVERMLGIQNLYDPSHIDILHHVNQALSAHTLFKRDVHYIVKDGQVIIVDEFTGRLMPGRRWSDGLHQAVEAKEGVRIERENQTLATITIQNYFRMYRKLAGMTGTADTEAAEFKKIYKLDVIVIPPNKQMIRIDHPDVVYKTEREKFEAVVEQIAECYERGQPVLVGTVSVEKSEQLSKMLKRRGVKHNVLNAVNHEAEANIIAQAGRLGTVTIATNMAGRGTDILLGGNPEFLARSEMENEWVRRTSNLPEGGAALRRRAGATCASASTRRSKRRGTTHEPLWKPLDEAQATDARGSDRGAPRLPGGGLLAVARRVRQALSRRSATAADAAYDSAAPQAAERYSAGAAGDRPRHRPAFRRRRASSASSAPGRSGAGRCASRRATAPARRAAGAPARRSSAPARTTSAPCSACSASRTDSADGARGEERATRRRGERVPARRGSLRRGAQAVRGGGGRRRAATYEDDRRKYTKVIEDVREQMEQAPDELRGRYSDILQKYQELCAVERQQVVDAGGLFILGTERHESRRIDNQLRGRAGRQGDPGASRFFLSLEDDLLRIFGAERIQGLMTRLGMEEGEPIEHRLITRAIANAQSKVEGAQLRHPQASARVRRRDEQAARGHLRAAARRCSAARPSTAQVMEMTDGVDRGASSSSTRPATSPAEEWDWAALERSGAQAVQLPAAGAARTSAPA